MTEEKTRKRIVEKCLKRTKFSELEIEKLLCAYENTMVDMFHLEFFYILPKNLTDRTWSDIWQNVKKTFSTVLTHQFQHDWHYSYGPDI